MLCVVRVDFRWLHFCDAFLSSLGLVNRESVGTEGRTLVPFAYTNAADLDTPEDT